jgi:uncharacterized membrane protein YoaK (UPF0700 family)
MFITLFIVFFAIPSALFLIGAIISQSLHLFFGGLTMALVSTIFFVVAKAVEKNKRKNEKSDRYSGPSPVTTDLVR